MSEKTKWISVEKELPKSGSRVVAIYLGVYGPRMVTFWKGSRGDTHFGHPNEADGEGSQPATHWLKLPAQPKEKP
jgi:hypothetical protein